MKELFWFSKSMLSYEIIPFMTGLGRNMGEGCAIVGSQSWLVVQCKQVTVGQCFARRLRAVPAWGHHQCRRTEPSRRKPWRMVQPTKRSCFRHGLGDSLLIVGCFIFPTTFVFWVSFLAVPEWCCCNVGLHQFPVLCLPVVSILWLFSFVFHFPISHDPPKTNRRTQKNKVIASSQLFMISDFVAILTRLWFFVPETQAHIFRYFLNEVGRKMMEIRLFKKNVWCHIVPVGGKL